jgi:hypothetical protein
VPSADIAHAVAHEFGTWALKDDRILVLGPDRHGHPLEVVLVERARQVPLAIHAMEMRRQYRRYLE